MGIVIHKATLVTCYDDETIRRASAMAVAIFGAGMVTLTAHSPVNSYKSFAILPCGSKIGWPEKTDDDRKRAQFHEWVELQAFDDGSNSLEVITVEYGSDKATP